MHFPASNNLNWNVHQYNTDSYLKIQRISSQHTEDSREQAVVWYSFKLLKLIILN